MKKERRIPDNTAAIVVFLNDYLLPSCCVKGCLLRKETTMCSHDIRTNKRKITHLGALASPTPEQAGKP